MPVEYKKSSNKQGILHALLPGARVDKNTKKILVRVGTSRETVIFNVGGTIFETYKSTLRGIPRSPLANEEFLATHFRPDKKDHFFDRDPEIFHCVLNYLRTGELHLPTSVCGPVVKSELEYWGVDEMEIEECCWNRYSTLSTTLKCEDDDDDMYTYFLDDPFVRTTLRGISVGRIGTKRKEYVSMHYVSCECEDDDDDMYTYFLDDPFVRTTLRGISVGRIGTKRKEYVSMHYVSCEALRKLEDDRKTAVQQEKYHIRENPSFIGRLCSKGWRFFSEPSSSCAAQIYAYVSLVIIFISIFSFCAQTHEMFQVKEIHNTTVALKNVPTLTSVYSTATAASVPLIAEYTTSVPSSEGTTQQYTTVVDNVIHPALYMLDKACVIYFVLELFCRFLVSPRKCRFMTKPMTIVEMMALVPDVIDTLVRLISTSHAEYKRVMSVIDFLKVLRVFRIFRLMKHIPGLWILFYTLKSSVMDLLLLLLFVFVGMLVFSSLIFFAESGVQEHFSSIPKCFWWAVITMTTVGYGDMYPVTIWGYLIGTATGISGVLMIGFTVPVLVNNFIMYYNHTRSTIRREKHRDKSMNGLANLHTPGSLKCFSGYEDFAFGDRLLGIGNYRMNTEYKDSNDNEKDTTDGIVFNVNSVSDDKTTRRESSNSMIEEVDESEETVLK